MTKSSRSDEIIRSRDQLHDGLTFLRKNSAADDVTMHATSAMAAGLSIIVGIALDLNRIADALESRGEQEQDR